ncbi:AAA domain-containing protein [Vulgatibacter sp.]|uniref:AAA domain-containing protein n=1 Tax=Vulgatibacter sp. TaxID=1971226 RepID=UPI00356A9709
MRDNRMLQRMLERLYAAIGSGPAINCRPHNSRQRIDLSLVARLEGTAPHGIVEALLAEKGVARLKAAVPMPPPRRGDEPTPDELRATEAWEQQQGVLAKLRNIADDARTWAQDHGAHVLQLGYPLLHVPPGSVSTRRILAPLAFVPLQVTVRTGRVQGVELAAVGEGIDRVVPNVALLAWVERQTGKKLGELFHDEEGADPWRELHEIAAAVAGALEIEAPLLPAPGQPIVPTRRSDDEDGEKVALLPSAVLGLFPIASLGLIRDTEAMLRGEVGTEGPVQSFLQAGMGLGTAGAVAPPAAGERLVTRADPCQARAVRLAREAKGLVVHGPPGSGKSQTITNIVGDHLARGERVLFVCDKRTALDVVHDRLEHLGLGRLCAVVHDPQRDQRDLYLGIREQLDGLAEAPVDPRAEAELASLEAERAKIHAELAAHHDALLGGENGKSFHDLVGAWLAEEATGEELDGVGLDAVDAHDRDLREILDRGAAEGYAENPWREALGSELGSYLATPAATWQARLGAAAEAARALDAAPSTLPFPVAGDVAEVAAAREAFAEKLEETLGVAAVGDLVHWAAQPREARAQALAQLVAVAPQVEEVRKAPLDPQLSLVQRPGPADAAVWLVRLVSWLQVARRWYGFLFFGRRKAARLVLERFGFTPDPEAGDRVAAYLHGMQIRQQLHAVQLALAGGEAGAGLPADAALLRGADAHRAVLRLLAVVEQTAELAADRETIPAGLGDPVALLATLRAAPARAAAVARAEASLAATELFAAGWLDGVRRDVRSGGSIAEPLAALVRRQGSVEGLLRMRRTLGLLPGPLADAALQLVTERRGTEEALSLLRKSGLGEAIRARLAAHPQLVELDAGRLQASHDRLRALHDRKQELVRRTILHRWTAVQRERLLAATGTRLNGAGTEVRRRLMLRGERAMRVRQVIATGQGIEGGDPIFELRPVWMASPQTVAQIFPAAPIFDVVIFDEASQCRLEEALPVLLRARRVVIAGDPKQLPPTRFFESAVAQSEGAFEAEDEQGLFEEQQADVEDLLGAALNLEIEQSHLDVHYRSANADLIEFSNHAFYESRLQAIPGHPKNRAEVPPIRLLQVAGTYEKRQNPAEAKAVVELVRELLAAEAPPSIGIACFNLAQRDLIADALDAAAADDASFATRLAAARERRGAGSFEGLFVKNLENVQGDERDVMIVSTTYGPDGRGRFYRRFGPLGMPGGGRRLNVLVTRARQMVHLVTSIPPEIYRVLPPVAQGQQPNGGWLLFSYLKYAEELAAAYGTVEEEGSASMEVRQSRRPSAVAQALGAAWAEAGLAGEVHWGNDGFCVDVALHPPGRPHDATGVLVDGSRYEKADDAVEWDLFRAAILEGQGWQLQRLWSPAIFRDPAAAVAAVEVAQEVPAAERREARQTLH